jgi:hypothetical protein
VNAQSVAIYSWLVTSRTCDYPASYVVAALGALLPLAKTANRMIIHIAIVNILANIYGILGLV